MKTLSQQNIKVRTFNKAIYKNTHNINDPFAEFRSKLSSSTLKALTKYGKTL